jgi:hypothetical protein
MGKIKMLTIRSNTKTDTILNYAENELGVKLDPSMSRDDLIAKVRELEQEAGIDTDDKEVKATEGVHQASGINPSKAVILIHQPPSHDEDSEPDTHCTIVLNGRNYQVKYGVDVEVPYGVYDILNNANQTKYFKKKNPDTQKEELHSKVVKRYPFSLKRLID